MEKELLTIFKNSIVANEIENQLYIEHNVKKGLRNEDGTGVLVGLTRISDVVGYKRVDGKKVDDYGELFYRGYTIEELTSNISQTTIQGYEETCFLILFGYLPNEVELQLFRKQLMSSYELPEGFLDTNLLRYPSINVMNKIQRALLMLYSEDYQADDTSVENTLKQGLNIIAKMPAIICYSYQGKAHAFDNESLIIHQINSEYSIAENILLLTRANKQFTKQEASLLDLMLVLHADHGGGNNSTFTNVVISSTGTDIYSAFAGAVGSLKGPRHGGANISVLEMMEAVKQEIGITTDKVQLKSIIEKLLNKELYDQSGLVYGIGHAVYTLSDPRSEILKKYAIPLAKEKNKSEELAFYMAFEEVAKEVIYERKGIRVSSNVDFYSGFVYEMLEIPRDLFSPLFVMSRTVGWLAHNIENKLYCNKIIRPATKYLGTPQTYVPLKKRG